MTVKGTDTLVHVNTGNTVALLVLNGTNGLVVYEFIDGAQVMGMRTGRPVPRGPVIRSNKHTNCIDKCRDVRKTCEEKSANEVEKDTCWDAFGLCASGCNVMFKSQPVSIHVIGARAPAVLQ